MAIATEPTPPAAPVTTIGPLAGRKAVPLQRHHREHGGVAGGADRHGLARAHARRQPHQPVALDARLLAIGAEMGLAAAPAVEDDLVARLPGRVAGGFHGAGEIDAGDHRKAAHHRRLAGDGEPVLVVQRRIFDADGDVAVHQVGFVEIGECGLGAALGLFDHDCLECRHARAPRSIRGPLWRAPPRGARLTPATGRARRPGAR